MPKTLESRIIRARERLRWRIHRRYQTVTQPVQVGRASLIFTRIADPDRVLDMVAAEEDRREKVSGQRLKGECLHLPYWAELWDSALGLAGWLERSGLIFQNARNKLAAPSSLIAEAGRPGRSEGNDAETPIDPPPCVLDLGCGMGLSGTVAAALGAHVMFADLESPALLFARLNSLPYRRRILTRRINWQTDRLDRTFDLILGADILYEQAQWEFLEPFWKAHLAAGGKVALGEPGRQTGDRFIPWIRERGWDLIEEEHAVATRPRPIRIFVASPRP